MFMDMYSFLFSANLAMVNYYKPMPRASVPAPRVMCLKQNLSICFFMHLNKGLCIKQIHHRKNVCLSLQGASNNSEQI